MEIQKLSNRYIAENHSQDRFMLLPKDIVSAFAFWVVRQTGNDTIIIEQAVNQFNTYVRQVFDNPEVPQWFTYAQLEDIINEDQLHRLTEVKALNEPTPDFIDLLALAKNTRYMVIRESLMEV